MPIMLPGADSFHRHLHLRNQVSLDAASLPWAYVYATNLTMHPPLIFLIGLPGAGKSTLAKTLANALNWAWMDTDHELEKVTGSSVPQQFADGGEQTFRTTETEVLAMAMEETHTIVATGGGLPAQGNNLRMMLAAGLVIWLNTPLEQCAGRLQAEGVQNRPLFAALTDAESIKTMLASLLEARVPYYAQAHLVVNDATAIGRLLSLMKR